MTLRLTIWTKDRTRSQGGMVPAEGVATDLSHLERDSQRL